MTEPVLEITPATFRRTSGLKQSNLYAKGNLDLLSHKHLLAIVGSRDVSEYGKHIIPFVLKNLSQQIVIVSGLSKGVDALSHSTSLHLKFKNIAVLPSGINNVYPSTHVSLAKTILAYEGLLLSEYPQKEQPRNWSFIERNKVIAHICDVLLVIEAGENSGSLATARFALKFGKKVFVVPGDIFRKNSLGISQLLLEGATPCYSAYQINESLGIKLSNTASKTDTVPVYGAIISQLKRTAASVEELIELTGMTFMEISGVLLELELAGEIYSEGGFYHAC